MTVISMVQDQAAIDSVQKAIESVTACYSTCTPTDFALLRQTLAAHFQDKKVKVSLFLQGELEHIETLLALPGEMGIAKQDTGIPLGTLLTDSIGVTANLPTFGHVESVFNFLWVELSQ